MTGDPLAKKATLILNPFDQYTFLVRYVPSIVITVPAMLLMSLFDATEFQALLKHAEWFLIVKNVGLGSVCVIFFTHVVRTLGKYGVEILLFKDGLRFPTTEMLLWKTRLLSSARKRQLHARIETDFNIQLCSEDEEAADEREARLRAKDVVGQIRLKVGAGVRTKQYNIHYGLFRNLASGTPLAFVMAILALIFVPGGLAKVVSWTYIVASVLYAFVSVPLLRHMGKDYAEYLFTEYLGKETHNA